jgi:hypothetical protein
MVQIPTAMDSQQTVGVIFKTERVSLRVLDQNGTVRQVQPHQITMRRDSNRAVATDADGHPIRISDTLKEVAGEVRRDFLDSCYILTTSARRGGAGRFFTYTSPKWPSSTIEKYQKMGVFLLSDAGP